MRKLIYIQKELEVAIVERSSSVLRVKNIYFNQCCIVRFDKSDVNCVIYPHNYMWTLWSLPKGIFRHRKLLDMVGHKKIILGCRMVGRSIGHNMVGDRPTDHVVTKFFFHLTSHSGSVGRLVTKGKYKFLIENLNIKTRVV